MSFPAPRSIRAARLLALSVWSLGGLSAACVDSPIEPPPDDDMQVGPVTPDTLRVLGHGAVGERYTGEVAVRGDWAYTTTWSTRAGQRGNAVKIWNVAG